ncbi:MAG: NHLP bacteriocin export ABC transporter permease/ATPase subunit [Acidobacteriota bacterium]
MTMLVGDHPVRLEDASVLRLVEGVVDLFATPVADDGNVLARHHLARFEAGQLLFPLPSTDTVQFLVVAVGTAEVETVDSRDSAILAGLDHWVSRLLGAIVEDRAPVDTQIWRQPASSHLAAGQTLRGGEQVLWLTQASADGAAFVGHPELPLGSQPLPLVAPAWLHADQAVTVDGVETAVAYQRSGLGCLDALNSHLPAIVEQQRQAREHDTRLRTARREGLRAQGLREAAGKLLAVLGRREEPFAATEDSYDQLLAAARIVGRVHGIDIQGPDPRLGPVKGELLQAITRASRIRSRQVLLRGEWWGSDAGPLLASRGKAKTPVALVPHARGYTLVDPSTGERLPVDKELAATLDAHAVVFYRPYPFHALGIRDVLGHAARDTGRDLRVIAMVGIAGGLLATLQPIITEGVFDSIIPAAERAQLYQVLVVLVVAAITSGCFELARRIAVLRTEGAMDAAGQSAVWDRLMALPVSFFGRYSAGDLATRSMAINQIQRTLAGTVLSGVLGLVFGLFNFALIFYYDAKLAVWASGVVLVAFLVTGVTGTANLVFQGRAQTLRQTIAGQLLQYLTAITKLRTTGSESTAFSLWAERFAKQRVNERHARMAQNALTVFNSAVPILGALVIYWRIETRMANDEFIATGTFVAFMAAFTAFLATVVAFGNSMISSLIVIPLYKNAEPILQAVPEADPARTDPGELAGKIELVDLHYRYRDDGPLVLKGFSLSIEPGEFVAIVGPSGAGKSTVMRLLLGFDTPESGTVLYDDQDLSGLDLLSVRRQLGVVLQDGQLLPGDILTNIIGTTSGLTIDDAWEATRMAGFEQDVKAMPMGMYTMVAGGTLSGGQQQRLLIARALVKKPRIVLMDEATSALDNLTQETVSDSLDKLAATRIVIAHRLSTIQRADRIFLIDQGVVAEQGSYEELMALGGEFKKLAERQLA